MLWNNFQTFWVYFHFVMVPVKTNTYIKFFGDDYHLRFKRVHQINYFQVRSRHVKWSNFYNEIDWGHQKIYSLVLRPTHIWFNIAHRSFLSIKYNFSSALANSRKKCRFLDCNVDTEVSEILACFCLSQVTVSVTSLLDEFNESTHTCQWSRFKIVKGKKN